MKDAFGHGSSSRGSSSRVDLMRQRVMLASDAKFTGKKPGPPLTDTQKQVADLRSRLSEPKGGLLHSFTQGIKNALSAGAKLHANSFAPTSRN